MTDIIQFDRIDEHGAQSYHARFDVGASELDRDELSSIGPVEIDVTVDRGDAPAEYRFDGTVHFTADFNCSRCLDPYPVAIATPFSVRFRPQPQGLGEADEVEIAAAEELDVEFYTGRTEPLRDLAVEQVQLSIPMKPLCNEACLGLCSQCGSNLNREKCDCGTSLVDERWGALKDIRDQFAKKHEV